MTARVVLVSLDAFVHRHLSLETTSAICALASAGGYAPSGGRCDLPSVTYTSHATLLSGRRVGDHGVLTGKAAHPEPGVVPGWAGKTHVARRTLFDACAEAGLRSAAVLGDQNLVQILNATAATMCWPPTGDPPEDEADVFGYRTNAAVHPHALAAVRDPANAFVFVHYNETDTVGHLYGPDAPETLACYTATDRLVGELADALRPGWAETVLIVVSDHGMELLPERPPFRLIDDPWVAAIASDEIDEVESALLRLREGVSAAAVVEALAAVEGVDEYWEVAPGVLLVAAALWYRFGVAGAGKEIVAGHGGRRETDTLAVVCGGHPAVTEIAARIAAVPPHLADWARWIAAVLGVAWGASAPG